MLMVNPARPRGPPTAVSGDVDPASAGCRMLAGVVGTGVGRHLCSRARPRPVCGARLFGGWASGAVCVWSTVRSPYCVVYPAVHTSKSRPLTRRRSQMGLGLGVR